MIGWRSLPEVAGHDVEPPDAWGAALVTVAVAALTFGLISVGRSGWFQPRVVASLAIGATLIAAFVLHCLKARNPLVEPGLFRNRNFASAFLGLAPFNVAFGALLLSLVLWEQGAWGWSALKTGLVLAPGPLLVPMTSLFVTPRLLKTLGPSIVAAIGLCVFSAACAWLALAVKIAPALPTALCGAVLSGVGVGLTMPTLMGAAAGSLPRSAFSTGSGVLNMVRQIGMVFGVAALVALVGSANLPTEQLADFRLAWWVMAAGAMLGLAPCLLMPAK